MLTHHRSPQTYHPCVKKNDPGRIPSLLDPPNRSIPRQFQPRLTAGVTDQRRPRMRASPAHLHYVPPDLPRLTTFQQYPNFLQEPGLANRHPLTRKTTGLLRRYLTLFPVPELCLNVQRESRKTIVRWSPYYLPAPVQIVNLPVPGLERQNSKAGMDYRPAGGLPEISTGVSVDRLKGSFRRDFVVLS